MALSSFPFEGGEILNRMGATWFVSYAYYEHCDRSHKNWDKVSTANMRSSYYNRGRAYHREWLQHILSMNDANLSKNTIGITPQETKRMAKAVLAKLS